MLSPTMWHFLSLSVSQVFAFIIPMTTKDFFHCENKNLHLKSRRWRKKSKLKFHLSIRKITKGCHSHTIFSRRAKRFMYKFEIYWDFAMIEYAVKRVGFCVENTNRFAILNSNRQIGFIATAVVFQSYQFGYFRYGVCGDGLCFFSFKTETMWSDVCSVERKTFFVIRGK